MGRLRLVDGEWSGRASYVTAGPGFQSETRCDRPSDLHRALAAELGIPVSQVTNLLAFARREFRTIVLEQIRIAVALIAAYLLARAALLFLAGV